MRLFAAVCFKPLDADGEKAREETVKAFHDLYRKNPAEFPPEAREKRYQELLRLSYPIHPELFDRLSKDWASLEKFQRTRGVLRFMANVIGVLWHSQTPDPLITPARVPVAHERVRASVLYPLDPAFAAVVDKEVDGDGSLPARMEASKPTARVSRDRAMRRAARAVFLSTAPLVGSPNVGIAKDRLRLACAEPGEPACDFRRSSATNYRKARRISMRRPDDIGSPRSPRSTVWQMSAPRRCPSMKLTLRSSKLLDRGLPDQGIGFIASTLRQMIR